MDRQTTQATAKPLAKPLASLPTILKSVPSSIGQADQGKSARLGKLRSSASDAALAHRWIQTLHGESLQSCPLRHPAYVS